jgi:DNA-binding HxlR family transcriptional regulator
MLSDASSYVHRVSLVTGLLQGKWKIHILYAMRTKPVRLSELTCLFPFASKKALTACLRS